MNALLHLDLINAIIKLEQVTCVPRSSHVTQYWTIALALALALLGNCSACHYMMAFSEHNFSGALATWSTIL
jgi:hypothetical protein